MTRKPGWCISVCVAATAAGMIGLGVATAQQKVAPAAPIAEAKTLMMYVGTYTAGKSKGIYLYRFDLATGAMTEAGVVEGVKNPSFLAIHPGGRFLYAVNEVGDYGGKKSGSVTAFSIDGKTGMLTALNHQATGGGAPCHLVVDGRGMNVLAANYSGGNVCVLPINEDGTLREASVVVQHEGTGPNARRQEGPHAHSINLDAANRFAFAADLGADKVFIYRFNAERGVLKANDPAWVSLKGGAGPRHFAFAPGERHAYVINELDSTLSAMKYDAERGELKVVQTVSTLPAGFEGGNSTADVHVHPSGRFVYGSNRGHDSIAMFRVSAETGELTPIGHEPTGGRTPRNFHIDPTGRYLLAANQATDSIVVFHIDERTGKLTRTEHGAAVPSPVCIQTMMWDR